MLRAAFVYGLRYAGAELQMPPALPFSTMQMLSAPCWRSARIARPPRLRLTWADDKRV